MHTRAEFEGRRKEEKLRERSRFPGYASRKGVRIETEIRSDGRVRPFEKVGRKEGRKASVLVGRSEIAAGEKHIAPPGVRERTKEVGSPVRGRVAGRERRRGAESR